MDRSKLEAAARALVEAGFVGSIQESGNDLAKVEELGRMQGATRVTFKYPAKGDAKAHAIDCAWLTIGDVYFNISHDRPLADGESMEADWRPQSARDAERAEATRRVEEAARATMVTPPRPVVCGESRWSWLEVD